MYILRVCEGSVDARLGLPGHTTCLKSTDQTSRHFPADRSQPGGAVEPARCVSQGRRVDTNLAILVALP
jgi:hypothetical protein